MRYLVVIAAAVIALGGCASGAQTAGRAAAQLNSSYATLSSHLNGWQGALRACDGDLSCVTKQDASAASYFAAFRAKLASTPVPGNAVAAQAKLSADVAAASRDFTQLSRTADVADYQSAFTSTGLQQTLTHFDLDYAAFVKALLDP